MARIRNRLAREEGFTLIELLVVIMIIGILLAIAVPSYLGFKDSANRRASSADVRAAIPSAEAFFSDTALGNYTYVGMITSALQGLDPAIKIGSNPIIGSLGKSYCLQMAVGGKVSSVQRGQQAVANGDIREGFACPATITDV